MSTPYWVQDSIFYQIFPDRFANGDHGNDPVNVQKWGNPPTVRGFQGGDLRGIIQHMDYLLTLGINAIYLNPIFLAASTHRYDTIDYFSIDPKLGTLNDFHALVDAAHQNGIRIVLDGVFNHCGRGFFAFADVMENDEHSPYRDWFYIKHFPVDAYQPGDSTNYLGWWNHKSLPKLNISNPRLREYILKVARYWIEQGADGWRLDVPNEIEDDLFWFEFQQVVKSANRDAYLLGEIWDINPRWVDESHFDGLMNYPVRDALLAFLQNRDNSQQFSGRIHAILDAYKRENLFSMYVPLGSHDTERIITLTDGRVEKVKMALLYQMAFPGAPAIYYGDEIGLEGGKDPDSRRAFPWKETSWNKELFNWTKTLISLRKKTPALRRGDYIELLVADDIYSFARRLGEEKILICLNASHKERQVKIPCKKLSWPEGGIVHGLIDHQEYLICNQSIALNLKPWQGTWIG